MKLSEAILEFRLALSGEKATRTVEWYIGKLQSLQAFLGNPEVDAITPRDLRLWRNALLERRLRYEQHPLRKAERGKLSPHTINGYVRAARRFFKWLIEEGIIKSNPALRLGLVRVSDENPRAISPEDMRKVLEEARKKGVRNYAIVCFLADRGCRVGGLVSLTLDRLDLKRRKGVVIEKHRGGGKARRVYISQTTADALKDWFAERLV